ncbi:prolyl-tRNA synthetase [Burkholderia pseudomallei]|nr:prolyl-tRNA synthetase [Burkholderia pseudomallei]
MSVRVPRGGRDASRDTKRFGRRERHERHERHERKASSCGVAIDLPPVRAGAAVRLRKRRPASRTGGRASDSIEPTGARSGNPAERTGDEPGEANRANAPLRGPAARPTSSPIGEGLADNAKRHEAA